MIKKWWKSVLVFMVLVFALSYAIKDRETRVSTHTLTKESNSISFDEAFRNAYNENGEGSLFNWNDNEYKVVFKEDR